MKTYTKFILNACNILLVCMSIGCSRDESATDIDGSANMIFEVNGINDEENVELVESNEADKDHRAIKKLSYGDDTLIAHEIIESNGTIDGLFDAVATLERDNQRRYSDFDGKTKINVSKSSNSASGNRAAVMPSGSTYRVLIYTSSDQYVGTFQATSGTQLSVPFPVNQNTTYNWYAYSFNNTANITAPTNTASPTAETTAGMTDVLHASGSITTVAGQNKINIQFARRLAVIKVRVDARGMFSPITTIAGSYTATNPSVISRAGIIDLKTGNYNSRSNSTAQTLNWVNESSTTGDSVKMAYIYTNGTSAVNGFTLNLSNLVIRLDNTSVPNRTFANKGFQFATSFTPTFGNRYTVNIILRESAVTVANVQWARSNMYYRPSDNGYRFRQQSSNIYQSSSDPTNPNEYWNWRAARPGPSEPTNIVDPCTRVYPYNTWRMPTTAETVSLSNITSGRTVGEADNASVRYVAWTVGANNEYGINWTSWLSFGYRNENSNTISNYQPSTLTYNGYWWTSSSTTATNAGYFGASFSSESAVAFSTNVYASSRNFGLNVRCVRR